MQDLILLAMKLTKHILSCRIENLMLLTNSEHMKVHSEARKRGDANA